MKFGVPFFIFLTLFLVGCELSNQRLALQKSPWYSESVEIVETYNDNHKVLDNGAELWIGKVKQRPSELSNLQLEPQKCLLFKNRQHREMRNIFCDNIPKETLSRINVGDIVAIVAHRGLKGEHRVCRIAKIDSSGKVLPIFGEPRIEVSSGINLNNGKQYVSVAYCVGGLIYKEDYRESEGRESQLHEKYDLNPANPVIRRRLCMEISMTDLNHRQLNAPPKATCSMPELKFYKILEKYDPPKQDAHTMYIELLELRDKGGNTEQYLNEKETYFKKRMIK